MNSIDVRIRYRPIRIGWCIRNKNLDDYERALKMTHTLWGGKLNPIIPIGNLDFAKQLVDLFRVDVLFPVIETSEISEFIDLFPYLPWPLLGNDMFVQGFRGKEPAFLDIYQAIRLLRRNLIKEQRLSDVGITLYLWDSDDPLSLSLLATFGSYPSVNDTGTDYDKLISNFLLCENKIMNKNDEIPHDAFRKHSKNSLTAYQLFGYPSRRLHGSGLYVGNAKDFDDLVAFWNLRAAGMNLYFYDPDYSDRLAGFRDAYLSELRSYQSDKSEFGRCIEVWAKKSKYDNFDLTDFGKDILRCQEDEVVWNGLNIQPSILHFEERTVLGTISDSPHRSLGFLLPPKPIHDTKYFYLHLVATISLWSDLWDERYTLKTLNIPELNEFYGRNLYFMWNQVRVEPDGIGIIIESFRDSITLNVLKLRDVVDNIFSAFGMRTKTSEAGLKIDRLINQMGGIQGCRVFKIAGVRDLIKRYKANETFTKSNAIQIIGQNDPNTGKPNFEKYENLVIESRPWKKKLKPTDVFKSLIRQGVFRVGLKLQCSHCKLSFWKSIDDIKGKTLCEYCGELSDITTQLSDRDWAYRKSGIFEFDENQAGGISVALTLQQLDSRGLDRFNYVTATEILPDTVKINKCESDFIIISQDHDGNVSLVLSECKTNDKISAQDVEKLSKVADSFPHNRIKTYLLFSKLAQFSEEEAQHCKKGQERYRNRVIMFTDRELERWFIYEDTEKLFVVDRHALRWEDLAGNTVNIFFEKRLVT